MAVRLRGTRRRAALQDVAAQVLVLGELAEMRVDVGRVDRTTRRGLASAASNETVSSSRSITVYRRRAPMFSVRSFTSKAISAMRRTPSGANFELTPSVAEQRLVLLGERGVAAR